MSADLVLGPQSDERNRALEEAAVFLANQLCLSKAERSTLIEAAHALRKLKTYAQPGAKP